MEITDGRLRLSLRRNTAVGENGGTEIFWKISEKGASAPLRAVARFKSAKKGRRDAEDAEDAEACVVGSVITLPLVVALVIALYFEAIRQLPSASVLDHKKVETRG